MKSFLIQKIEKFNSMLFTPYELKREICIRANAIKVAENYKNMKDRAPFPSVVLLVVNEICNQRCLVCDLGRREDASFYYQAHFKGRGTMSKETFKSVVDSVKRYNSEIWLLATEPLLYQHLDWAIEYASSFGVKTQLTTNGYLLPETAEKLVKLGIKGICLSIDGHTASLHDFIRGCPGAYDKAIAGLKKVMEAKKKFKKKMPYIYVNVVINQWNCDSLEKIVESLSVYDIDGIVLSHLQFLTKEIADAHTLAHKEFPVGARNIFQSDRKKLDPSILFEQLLKIKKNYSRFRINFAPDLKNIEDVKTYYFNPGKAVDGYSVCYVPWRYPHILANGDVVVNYECFSKTMGNINEQGLSSIWNGEKFRSFRRFIMSNNGASPACYRCPMIYCGYKL